MRPCVAVTDAPVAPRFARGIRFRRLDDGSGVLLVPEGVVNLTESAAAIAELVDGFRTQDEIGAALAASFEAPPERIAADVADLLARFAQKTWVDLPEPQA
jgi:pyrroloquinoline quinone biosynthesis protein D